MTADNSYARALADEGTFWDNEVAKLLGTGEIPGSVDFRLFFTQRRMRLGWEPPLIGGAEINFRRREVRQVMEAALVRPGARILDLGAGAGWLSLELARQGAHVIGIDLSPINRDLARYASETHDRNFPYLYRGSWGLPLRPNSFGSVEYLHGDLNTITLPVREFDAIVVWDSLHHVRDIERLFEEVRRALKPGGVFVGVDHTDPTIRTVWFSREVRPLLQDLCQWVTTADPGWLYSGVAGMCEPLDWGVLAIDPPSPPIEGAPAFLDRVMAEMRQISAASAPVRADGGSPQAVSPFEDVSAGRLMPVLLEHFRAIRFETVCPLVMDGWNFPEARIAAERVFQHYLAATVIRMGERAIARAQADGQWFIFACSGDPPPQGQVARYLERPVDSTEQHIRNLEAIVSSRHETLRRCLGALSGDATALIRHLLR